MPVSCGLHIEPITTDKFAALDYRVMNCAFVTQNLIGRLADERIYEALLAHRLEDIGLRCHRQVPIQVTHKTFQKTYFLDIVVDGCGVYELKTASQITGDHLSQLLNYLHLLNLPRGKLINFRSPKVESQFVNAPISASDRHTLEVDARHSSNANELAELVLEILRDLGTSLSLSLYQEIVVHLLGGEESVVKFLPLADGTKNLGNQRFYLSTSTEAFHITCFPSATEQYEQHLQLLLQLSPLDAIHWINIDLKQIRFRTVFRLR